MDEEGGPFAGWYGARERFLLSNARLLALVGLSLTLCSPFLCCLSRMDHSQGWLGSASVGDALRAPHVGKPRYLAIKLTPGI